MREVQVIVKWGGELTVRSPKEPSETIALQVGWRPLLGARTLLGAPGLTTRNKKLLGAPGIATKSKDASRLEAAIGTGLAISHRSGWRSAARGISRPDVTRPEAICKTIDHVAMGKKRNKMLQGKVQGKGNRCYFSLSFMFWLEESSSTLRTLRACCACTLLFGMISRCWA